MKRIGFSVFNVFSHLNLKQRRSAKLNLSSTKYCIGVNLFFPMLQQFGPQFGRGSWVTRVLVNQGAPGSNRFVIRWKVVGYLEDLVWFSGYACTCCIEFSFYTEYFWQFGVQGQSEVIRCSSDFRQPFILQKWIFDNILSWKWLVVERNGLVFKITFGI